MGTDKQRACKYICWLQPGIMHVNLRKKNGKSGSSLTQLRVSQVAGTTEKQDMERKTSQDVHAAQVKEVEVAFWNEIPAQTQWCHFQHSSHSIQCLARG